MTTPGHLNDETEPDSIELDVRIALQLCMRDEEVVAAVGVALQDAAVKMLASKLTRTLLPKIGGRYLPKSDEAQRRKRNAEVVAAFNGRNHAELKRRFKISHRLLNYILEEARKQKVAQRI